MPNNPFPTRQEWQKEKKNYGIPDKIIKSGMFGEKMEKLKKAYDARGGKNVDVNNMTAVLQVLQSGQALVDEWLKKARAMKSTEFKNKVKAIEVVEHYEGMLEATVSRVHSAVDPLHEARTGIQKAITMYRKSLTNPTDADGLYKLWDSGGRQLVGQGFRLALKNADTVGYSPAVKKQLQDYDDLMAKWMKTMLDGHVKDLAADPAKRGEFLDDMEQAFRIATATLQATAG